MESIREAEAVKIFENSFRDINIAFVNEMAMSFAKLGIDVVNVIDGAATKPFGFIPHYPGCGVGGHCIPVDPYYLIAYAKDKGFDHTFLKQARRVNSYMPQFVYSLMLDAVVSAGLRRQDLRVCILGVAYKPGIDDDRNSPGTAISNVLKENKVGVSMYDAYTPNRSEYDSLRQALEACNVIIVATAHPEFVSLTAQDFEKYGIKVVIDGRNCYDKSSFKKAKIEYRGIGRC
jgi:nucleotide sugar dehydrogenase